MALHEPEKPLNGREEAPGSGFRWNGNVEAVYASPRLPVKPARPWPNTEPARGRS